MRRNEDDHGCKGGNIIFFVTAALIGVLSNMAIAGTSINISGLSCSRMKKILIVIVLFCLPAMAFNQRVTLITIDQLNERIGKGRDTIFVINFWATWCSPCIKELSFFEKFGIANRAEKLKVLLVSVNYKSELNSAVIKYVKKENIKSEVFLLDEKDQQEYINRIDTSWSGSIPATLFIKNGKRLFFEKDFTFDDLQTMYKSLN